MALPLLIATRLEGVLGTLVEAVENFNANNWTKYATYLDENAVAYNLSTFGYTQGRDKIMKYFSGISSSDPADLQFDLTNDITWFPSAFPLSVSGVALWTHAASHHRQVRINYEFQFNPGNFLLTSVWAEHLIGD